MECKALSDDLAASTECSQGISSRPGLDREASDYGMDILDPHSFGAIAKLVLDEARVPRGHQIFRMPGYRNLVFVRRDLAEAISARGLSGIRFIELAAHRET